MYEQTWTPWRYRCPHCGSVCIYRRSQHSIPELGRGHPGKRVSVRGSRRTVKQYIRRWYCKRCGNVFDWPKDMARAQA